MITMLDCTIFERSFRITYLEMMFANWFKSRWVILRWIYGQDDGETKGSKICFCQPCFIYFEDQA